MTTRPPATALSGRAADAGGRATRLYLVRALDGGAAASNQSLAARLEPALGRALPDLSFDVIDATGAAIEHAVSGLSGPRDFRVAAALAGNRPRRGDLIAVQMPASPGITVLKMRSVRADGSSGLMAPALEGLCSLGDLTGGPDLELLALASVAIALAAVPADEATGTRARLVERLALPVMQSWSVRALADDPIAGTERAILAAWAMAWIGKARGDVEGLELARRALDDLIANPHADLTARELAQLHANLGVVCQALAVTAEGSRRLSEGLAAARSALQLVDAATEPAMQQELTGLRGELAAGLGLRSGDRLRLVEAEQALEDILDSPFCSDADTRHRRALLDQVRAALARSPRR